MINAIKKWTSGCDSLVSECDYCVICPADLDTRQYYAMNKKKRVVTSDQDKQGLNQTYVKSVECKKSIPLSIFRRR